MFKPDFSNGLHNSNGYLDADKIYWYDKLKEEQQQEQKEKESREPRNLTK